MKNKKYPFTIVGAVVGCADHGLPGAFAGAIYGAILDDLIINTRGENNVCKN